MTQTPAALAGYTLESVAWDDPRAVALRDVMDDEILRRYSSDAVPRIAAAAHAALLVDPDDVRATLLMLDPAGVPVGHGALRILREDWEVKRVVVAGGQRGRGVGRTLMQELERIARAGRAPRVILQTGDRQPEAVALYERLGYTRIPIYEPYVTAIPFSLCFEKVFSDEGG